MVSIDHIAWFRSLKVCFISEFESERQELRPQLWLSWQAKLFNAPRLNRMRVFPCCCKVSKKIHTDLFREFFVQQIAFWYFARKVKLKVHSIRGSPGDRKYDKLLNVLQSWENIWNGCRFSIFPYAWTSDLFRFYSLDSEKSILAFSSPGHNMVAIYIFTR